MTDPTGTWAPAPKRANAPILLSGLLTTAAALFGVCWLDTVSDDFHIMGWYGDYIIPAGAVLVGAVAGSGYGLASWFTGVKISRGLLWTVVLLQVAAYAASQYAEFAAIAPHYKDGTPVGFVAYFDLMTRAFAWREQGGHAGVPIGVWGYAFRGLEVAGFSLGGLVAPMALQRRPYCVRCQVYMRTKKLVLLPAGIHPKRIKSGGAAAELELRDALQFGRALLQRLGDCAAAGRASEFHEAIAPHLSRKKEYSKLSHRIQVTVSDCSQCHCGFLSGILVTGSRRRQRSEPIGRWDVASGTATRLRDASSSSDPPASRSL